jgi:hypothetical protein
MIEPSAIACISVAPWVDALKVASQIHFVQHDKERWLLAIVFNTCVIESPDDFTDRD